MHGLPTINKLEQLANDNAEAARIMAQHGYTEPLVSLHCEHPVGCVNQPDRRKVDRAT